MGYHSWAQDIQALFGPGGALERVDPRFEPRPQQLEMALAVARALERGESLVVEAATGVGKSLAYLLPGALWAITQGRRLLVSTHTRALQEQILEKDLPMAAKVLSGLGLSLRGAMLQGSDNYLCVQRLARLREEPELLAEARASRVEEMALWAKTAGSGHRQGLPFLVPQGLWSRIARDPDRCLGPLGRYWSQCLYRKDREKAERSHVLVVNHALLLSGARLPPWDALVIDEAHNLEEVAVSRFGVSVSQASFARLQEEAQALARDFPELAQAAAALSRESLDFFERLARACGLESAAEEPSGRLLDGALEIEPPGSLQGLERALEALVAAEAAPDPETDLELRLAQGRAASLRRDIGAVLGAGEDRVARWVERSGQAVELRAAPLDVSQRLREGIFARGAPVVFTSATLSWGRGLGEFRAQVGLAQARELSLGSPFDYPSQAALLVLGGLPEPSDSPRYASALASRCRRVLAQVPGGVFILFSSWKMLRRVHERLRRCVKDRPLWVQGASGSEALLADFIRAGNAVLLGVDTFWQGVDVPGEALSCVVLTKLPFPSFGSPLEAARRRFYDAQGRSYFDDWSLPRAVMKFRQGFGRLIRSSADRGAVVALDSRLLSRGYGQAFLEALPRCRRLERIEDLGEFFAATWRA